MNILITGSYGQLGSEIRTLYTKKAGEHHFIFTDVDTLDICDETAVSDFFAAHKIDLVVNCAAYTAVDKAESDTDKCRQINSLAVRNLMSAAKRHGARIIHISTDYVFDGTAHKPYVETDRIAPQSVYGSTKAEGEAILLDNYADGSIIIRTSWLYSTFGNNFVKTMLRLGKERKELSVVFDQVGSPTNAADLAEAILSIVCSDRFEGGVYHYSNEGVCSWYDFAEAIFRLSGYSTQLHPIRSSEYPTRAERPHYSVLDKARVREAFGITIPHWRTALEECLQLTASLPE